MGLENSARHLKPSIYFEGRQEKWQNVNEMEFR